jgi:hypothetical protein
VFRVIGVIGAVGAVRAVVGPGIVGGIIGHKGVIGAPACH